MVKGKNLKQFCANNNLGYWGMYKLMRGQYAQNLGWRAFHSKSKKDMDKEKRVLHNLYTGEEATLGPLQYKFAEEHGLHHSILGELLNGKRIVYKGWVLDSTYQIMYGKLSIQKFEHISNWYFFLKIQI